MPTGLQEHNWCRELFFEPTELTVLPNLDVLVAQRRGELMLYKDKDHSVKQVGFLNVYWKTLQQQCQCRRRIAWHSERS